MLVTRWTGRRSWFLADAQFSVVALVDSAAAVLERVRYSPYGEAQHQHPANYSYADGDLGVQDIFDWLAVYFTGTGQADFNRDGTVGSQDIFDYLAVYLSNIADAMEGWVSDPDVARGGSDSVIGYCGYVFNHETGDYTVRFRCYSPSLGRWLERDPRGTRWTLEAVEPSPAMPFTYYVVIPWSIFPRSQYDDGSHLIEYVRSRAIVAADASGLISRGVFICKRSPRLPAPIAQLGKHWWIVLPDGSESGLGPEGGGVPGQGGCDLPCIQTTWNDHAGQRFEAGADCNEVFGCDVSCLARATAPGTPQGRWVPGVNDCNTVVTAALTKCKCRNQCLEWIGPISLISPLGRRCLHWFF